MSFRSIPLATRQASFVSDKARERRTEKQPTDKKRRETNMQRQEKTEIGRQEVTDHDETHGVKRNRDKDRKNRTKKSGTRAE